MEEGSNPQGKHLSPRKLLPFSLAPKAEEQSSGSTGTAGRRIWFGTRHQCEAKGPVPVKGLGTSLHDIKEFTNHPQQDKNSHNTINTQGWVDFHKRSKSCIFSESHTQLWDISEGMLIASTEDDAVNFCFSLEAAIAIFCTKMQRFVVRTKLRELMGGDLKTLKQSAAVQAAKTRSMVANSVIFPTELAAKIPQKRGERVKMTKNMSNTTSKCLQPQS